MERLEILKANEHKFWLRVKKDNPDLCWVWTKYKDKDGYGDFQFRFLGKKYIYRASRVSYELTNGLIPNDLIVCHKCDNPQCVNPNHLFIGTHKNNVDDKVSKNRQAKAESSGRSKLNWFLVNEMRKNYNNDTKICDLAKKHDVDGSSIRDILRGITWKDENYVPIEFEDLKFDKGHTFMRVLSEEKVKEIKILINKGLMPKEISEITGVENQKIKDIKRGVAYFNIKV